MERAGVAKATSLWLAKNGLCVRSGPFRGMEYVTAAVGSSVLPKLVGSYECELHPWLEEIGQTPYSLVVDVGAAEGYYAVGLAMRLVSARVLAFDLDGTARRLCESLAGANGVSDRVSVHGACDHARLREVLSGRTLLVCDCEGCEATLLDPVEVPSLRTTDMLIELHHDLSRITERISERFQPTHSLEFVDSAMRDPDDWAGVEYLPIQWRGVAVDEFRNGPQRWAMLRTRHT